jgi:AcrR family transcriptional regulator
MPASPKRREPPQPLFSQLSGGHGAPPPKRVAEHQRRRLQGAMVEAVARSGYANLTIRELVALAGISKSAFYRHFDDKQSCFLATFEEIVTDGARRVGEGYRSGEGLRGSLEAGLSAFAQIIATEPAAASLVLVDSLALGTAAIAHREAAAERFEALVLQSFAAQGTPLSALQARAIVAGWRRIAYRALRAAAPERLLAQVPELVAWALSYRGAAVVAVPPLPLPSPSDEKEEIGWSESPAGAVARRALDQRQRIVRATAQLAAEGGYESVTIPAISERAGTSNESWYEHFDSKQAAFLTAFDELMGRAFTVAVDSFEAQTQWAEGVAAGIAALLAHIVAEPIFARIAFFELAAVGPAGLERSDRALEAFTAYLRPESFDASAPQEVPAVTRDAIGGGIWAAVQHELAHDRSRSLPALAPQFAALALAPFDV